MPTLIDMRRRIKSVKNTEQITKAMKTVATAKFKKAKRMILERRPYWHNAPDLMAQIALWASRVFHPLLIQREERKIHAVFITSDKGLCGAFNSNLLAQALSFLEEKSSRSEVRLILIGKKAFNFFKKYSFPVEQSYFDKVDKLRVEDLQEMARHLMRLYTFCQTDAVYIVYNEFKSVLAPRIILTKILPLEPSPEESGGSLVFPDWEPRAAALLETLIPRYVENQFCHFFFESLAAEQAARMMAMENASQNAEELISRLVLVMNKIRQASITKELLEIMTAVDALSQ
ncbi:MAG: ATP synthase F1 subunit gamma [Candidatus Aminicenantales bacterium]